MPIQFEPLCSNLIETYSVLHDSTGSSQLVANFSGSCLYNASTGWGRLWRWFYNFLALFGQYKDIAEKKLLRAIGQTEKLFKQQMGELNPSLVSYRQYLDGVSQEESAAIEGAKKKIYRWNRPVKLLTGLLNNKKVEDATLSKISFLALIKDVRCEKVQRYEDVICLEELVRSVSAYPLPTAALKKLSLEKRSSQLSPLTDGERKDLHEWLVPLEAKAKKGTINFSCLHRGLRSFLELTGRDNEGDAKELPITDRLTILEWNLHQQIQASFKYDLFSYEDRAHMQWRNALVEGDKVFCGQSAFTLGPLCSDGKDLLFNVQDNEDQLVWVSNNPIALLLKERLQRRQALIPAVGIIAIDPAGSCAVIEKLHATDTYMISSEASKKQFIEFIQRLSGFIQEGCCPDVSMLQVDREGRFKRGIEAFTLAGEVSSPKAMTFLDLISFVAKMCRQDYAFYKEVMQKTGLWGGEYPAAQFYKELAQRVLEHRLQDDVEKETRILASTRSIVNETMILRAVALQKGMGQLLVKGTAWLSGYPHKGEGAAKQAMEAAGLFLEEQYRYLEDKILYWPFIKEMILEKWMQSKEWRGKFAPPPGTPTLVQTPGSHQKRFSFASLFSPTADLSK
jgi:hypothetical protein